MCHSPTVGDLPLTYQTGPLQQQSPIEASTNELPLFLPHKRTRTHAWCLQGELTQEEQRRERARQSLERYLHYYERWSTNEASWRRAKESLKEVSLGEGYLRQDH